MSYNYSLVDLDGEIIAGCQYLSDAVLLVVKHWLHASIHSQDDKVLWAGVSDGDSTDYRLVMRTCTQLERVFEKKV